MDSLNQGHSRRAGERGRGIRAPRVRDEDSRVGGRVTRHSRRVHTDYSITVTPEGATRTKARHADEGSGSRLARSRPPSRPQCQHPVDSWPEAGADEGETEVRSAGGDDPRESVGWAARVRHPVPVKPVLWLGGVPRLGRGDPVGPPAGAPPDSTRDSREGGVEKLGRVKIFFATPKPRFSNDSFVVWKRGWGWQKMFDGSYHSSPQTQTPNQTIVTTLLLSWLFYSSFNLISYKFYE